MSRVRVAIVDDDRPFGTYLATVLGSSGYQVDTFAGGEALLDALAEGADPHVVLLDVLMPGMDGLETLRAVRRAHPDLQVIMLSGTQVPATIVNAVRLGAVDYVVKPDDAEGIGEAALEAAVRSAADKASLTREVRRLRAQIAEAPDAGLPCWSDAPAMRPVQTMIERVADSEVTVLISGESGVGKEVVARELHRRSARRERRFVKVTCAALPAELLESELFGHERGAFTGAQALREGRFEFADQGTIMLDEIGEMPAPLQAKLLHVLQDREFARLGTNRPISVDVRVIAATNRDLTAMMRAGEFREDLYYRLQEVEIRVPPLRDRPEAILPLVEHFLVKYAALFDRPAATPSTALRDALVTYHWPGNVRELENVVKRYVVLDDEAIVLGQLRGTPGRSVTPPPGGGSRDPDALPPAPPDGSLLDRGRRAARDAERALILEALQSCRWNRRRAAERLGVSYKTLLNKMKRCAITASGDR